MIGRGYRYGVRWIAVNDEPGDFEPDRISGYISTLLLADLFGKDPEEVAADVVTCRKKEADVAISRASNVPL